MKKILVNTRCLSSITTGVQRYTKEILGHLPGKIEYIKPAKKLNGVSGHAWEQFALPLLTKKNILWSPSNTGPLLVKRQVVSILDLSTIDHPEWFSPKFSTWYQFLLPRLAQRTKHILTISEFSKSRIMEKFGINDEKITVSYLATDHCFQIQENVNLNDIRKQLNLPNHYLLALGSLEPRKNLVRLIRAWDRIQPKLPEDICLVIAGAKGNATIFKKLSFDALPKKIIFTGHIPDELLPGLYAGAVGFIYPSIYEGFGLPPLEAMSCGTPVITSNTTSLPEVVGDAALLINPLDVEQIAHAMQTLVNDSALRDQLRQKGLQRAKLFSWQKTAEITWQVLQAAAEKN